MFVENLFLFFETINLWRVIEEQSILCNIERCPNLFEDVLGLFSAFTLRRISITIYKERF